MANIDVSRRRCEEKSFFYLYVLIRYGIAKCATRKTNSLVSLVEDRNINRRKPTRAITDNFR